MRGLASAIYRTIIGAAGASSLSAFLLANPIGWIPLGFIVAGVGGFEALSQFRHALSAGDPKQLDRFEKTVLRELLGGLKRAAERIQIDQGGKLDLSGLEAHEKNNPYIIIYRLLQTRFNSQDQAIDAIDSTIRDNEKLLFGISAFLRRNLAEIRRSQELTSDEIRSLHAGFRESTAKLDKIIDQTKSAPFLSTPLQSPVVDDVSRFDFRIRLVPLFGREAELDQLHGFLESRKPLLWWIWYGPGGQGKSRLAFELILDAQSRGWRAGFLSENSTFDDWDRWEPDSPTLVVVDYVGSKASEIGKALACLAERVGLLDHPIRFLLLERSADEDDRWMRELLSQGRATLSPRRHSAPHLLKPLVKDDDLWAAIEFVVQTKNSPERSDKIRKQRNEILEQLHGLGSEHRRPLFAAFIAEALAEPGIERIRNWNADDLVNHILRREADRWMQAGVTEDHINLLVLATCTAGIERSTAYKLAERFSDVLPRMRSVDETTYGWISGYTERTDRESFAALEPDVLGECLVLERLVGWSLPGTNKDVVRNDARTIVDHAWQIAPGCMMGFVVRCAQDFPTHEGIDIIFEQPPVTAPIWPVALTFLVNLGHESRFELFSRLVDEYLCVPGANHSNAAVFHVLYYRGVRNGQLGKHQEALCDFNVVVDIQDAPAEMRAEALYSRGIAYGKLDNPREAIDDYTAVIEMPDASADQKAKALNNRGNDYGRMDRLQEAIDDYTAVIEMPDAPAEQKVMALNNRSVVYRKLDKLQESIEDLTAIIAMPDVPVEKRTNAFLNRAVIICLLGKPEQAIDDYTAVIEAPDAPAELKANSLYNRGFAFGELGKPQEANDDFTAVINTRNTPPERRAIALHNRGVGYGRLGIPQRAIGDFTAVIEMPHAAPELKGDAHCSRGVEYEKLNMSQEAIDDYTAVIEIPGASAKTRARAFLNRGAVLGQQGNPEEAIDDFTVVIETPDAPAEHKAWASNNRGLAYDALDKPREAIDDYTTVIEMPDAPAEQKARALNNRGGAYLQLGSPRKAIDDYTAVIAMPDASIEQKVMAFSNRVVIYNKLGKP